MNFTKNGWPAAVVGLVGTGVLGGLHVLGVNDAFLMWLGGLLLLPLMTAFIMGGQAQTHAAVQTVQQQTQAVQTTVNGNTSRMLDMIDRYAQALAVSTPPPPTTTTPAPPAPGVPPA